MNPDFYRYGIPEVKMDMFGASELLKKHGSDPPKIVFVPTAELMKRIITAVAEYSNDSIEVLCEKFAL